MDLPTRVDYPLIVIADLHGQRSELESLVARLSKLPEWPDCALVFLGDFVDRGPDVPGTIDLVLKLLRRPAGGSATMGNHDLGLTRAARLDDGPPSPYWIEHYRTRYDHESTFKGYLRRRARLRVDAWQEELHALRSAVPKAHRDFLVSLPWLVEAPGHLFLHNGLSPELTLTAEQQVEALRRRVWDRTRVPPLAGTRTAEQWRDEYPVWLGADRSLSEYPLRHPTRIQVTGHAWVAEPRAHPVRIRLDTSGGFGTLTACLLRAPDAEPVFVRSRDRPPRAKVSEYAYPADY